MTICAAYTPRRQLPCHQRDLWFHGGAARVLSPERARAVRV